METYSGDLFRKNENRLLIEINKQAIGLVLNELDIIDAVRFLKQFTQGFGNYSKARENLFNILSREEIVNEIQKRRMINQ